VKEIIEEIDENKGKTISIGDDSAGRQISFQLAQDFYNEITGKSEVIEENIDLAIIIDKNDIEQLNLRVHQTLEQYNVVSLNYSLSVKYMKDSSERYSSIERFSLHAGNKGKVVENIELEYRLLIILPKVQRPQEYKITVSIRSREAEIESMKDKFGELKFGFPFHFFEKSNTAAFKIEFIDISVARALMSSLTDWVGTLNTTSMNVHIKNVRSKSSYFPIGSKYLFLFVSFYSVFQYSNIYFLRDHNLLPKGLALFIISTGMLLFLMHRIGLSLGRVAERNLDSLYESSYINLSKSDEELACGSARAKRRAITKSSISLAITFVFCV
jgi:hypothetical protein